MRVVFWVDAGGVQGFGGLMRALAMSEALAARGVAARFVDGGHRNAPLRHRAIRVEFGGALKRTIRFVKPKRMHQRQSLIEKRLRFGGFRGYGHLHLAVTFHQLRLFA